MRKILLLSIVFVVMLLGWLGESRRFFCVGNGAYITVWKTYNNTCYIIPGKYYGLLKPSKNYIESSNTNSMSIFYTNLLPHAFVYKSEENLIINNSNKREFTIYNYDWDVKKFDKILYTPNARKSSDVNPGVYLVNIFIQENYALDKDGKRLH
jgi:hypothetical protein